VEKTRTKDSMFERENKKGTRPTTGDWRQEVGMLVQIGFSDPDRCISEPFSPASVDLRHEIAAPTHQATQNLSTSSNRWERRKMEVLIQV
jgi:hypothetical protein